MDKLSVVTQGCNDTQQGAFTQKHRFKNFVLSKRSQTQKVYNMCVKYNMYKFFYEV